MDANKMLTERSDLPVALREDEKILGRAHISQGIYWKAIAVAVIAVLFGLLIARNLGLFLAIVAFLVFAYYYLLKSFLVFIVTNQRILIRSGILKVDTVQIRLDRVESVEIQRTIAGQILGYATLIVTGTGSRLAFIPYISNAAPLRDGLDSLLYQREKTQNENSTEAS